MRHGLSRLLGESGECKRPSQLVPPHALPGVFAVGQLGVAMEEPDGVRNDTAFNEWFHSCDVSDRQEQIQTLGMVCDPVVLNEMVDPHDDEEANCLFGDLNMDDDDDDGSPGLIPAALHCGTLPVQVPSPPEAVSQQQPAESTRRRLPKRTREWEPGDSPSGHTSSFETPPKRRRLVGKVKSPDGSRLSDAELKRIQETVAGAEAQMEYLALTRYWQKRNYFCTRWIRSRPEGYFHKAVSWAGRYQLARQYFKELSDEKALLEGGQMGAAGMGGKGKPGAPAGNANAAKGKTIVAKCVMVTWNVAPGTTNEFKMLWLQLRDADPECHTYDDLIARAKNLPEIQTAWTRFYSYFIEVKKDLMATDMSACMELSLKADTARWHFHLSLSRLRGAKIGGDAHSSLQVTYDDFAKFAEHPVINWTSARGRASEAAVHKMQSYCQLKKIGSVYRYTDYPKGVEYVCRQAWTIHAWQLRKLSCRVAKEEIRENRDGIENGLRKIDEAWYAEMESLMRQGQAEAYAKMQKNLKPFKHLQAVEDWMQTYKPENRYKECRFKFLVLHGDSRYGKTRYAASLWGPERSCVINCQGVSQPSLANYDPRRHDVIILDEPDQSLVNACKVFLQAGLEGTELY